MRDSGPCSRRELTRRLLVNFHDAEREAAWLREPSVALALDTCCEIGGRHGRCIDNAERGREYLRSRGYPDVRVALGFMVEHEYWRIQVVEHGWLVVRDGEREMIVDPTLPFLCLTQLPTYFEGATLEPDRPFPDLRNRRYKAAFAAAKHLAETCDFPGCGKIARRVHIGRIKWIEGLDDSECVAI